MGKQNSKCVDMEEECSCWVNEAPQVVEQSSGVHFFEIHSTSGGLSVLYLLSLVGLAFLAGVLMVRCGWMSDHFLACCFKNGRRRTRRDSSVRYRVGADIENPTLMVRQAQIPSLPLTLNQSAIEYIMENSQPRDSRRARHGRYATRHDSSDADFNRIEEISDTNHPIRKSMRGGGGGEMEEKSQEDWKERI